MMPLAARPPAGSRAPPLSGDLIALWQFEDDYGNWADYTPEFNELLEYRFQTGADFFKHIPGDYVEFIYHFVPFIQENTETHRRRPMRRVFVHVQMLQVVQETRRICEVHNTQHHSTAAAHDRMDAIAAGDRRSRSSSRPRL